MKLEYNQALGRDFTLDELRKRGFEAICVTVGTQQGVKLGLPGEEAAGFLTAVDFIRSHNAGQTPALGRSVAIIGGGFTAVDAARIAVRAGAEQVFICYRRTRDEMPAVPEEVFEAEEEGVRVMYLVSPTAIETARRPDHRAAPAQQRARDGQRRWPPQARGGRGRRVQPQVRHDHLRGEPGSSMAAPAAPAWS